MTDNIEALKYPIGKYQRPDSYDTNKLNEWISVLEALPSWLDTCIENLDHAQLHTPYRPDGWTVQQVLHHLADSHINMYIRMKFALTADNPTIMPYDENKWALLYDVEEVPVNISITLLHALHRRIIAVMRKLTHLKSGNVPTTTRIIKETFRCGRWQLSMHGTAVTIWSMCAS